MLLETLAVILLLAQVVEVAAVVCSQLRSIRMAGLVAQRVTSLAARLVLPTEHLQLSKAAQALQAMLLRRVLVGVAAARLTGPIP
jgi:hypothetical protein